MPYGRSLERAAGPYGESVSATSSGDSGGACVGASPGVVRGSCTPVRLLGELRKVSVESPGDRGCPDGTDDQEAANGLSASSQGPVGAARSSCRRREKSTARTSVRRRSHRSDQQAHSIRGQAPGPLQLLWAPNQQRRRSGRGATVAGRGSVAKRRRSMGIPTARVRQRSH